MPVLQDCLDRLHIIGRRSGSFEQKNWRNIVRRRWSAGRQDQRRDARDKLNASAFHETRATPNDPSDGGGWRAGCVVGERRRQEAASVTAGAVRWQRFVGRLMAVHKLFRLRGRQRLTSRPFAEKNLLLRR